MKSTKYLFLFIILTTMTAPPVYAEHDRYGEDPSHVPSAEAMAIDGLVYRPLSLAGTLLGTGIFLVTLPFSLISGNADNAGQRLVVEPAEQTFKRCLGCIDNHGHSMPR